MIGTFLIAWELRLFKSGHFLGRTVRKALGDFGVPIGIIIMVLIDYLGVEDTYTEKLNVPDGLALTAPDKRGWIINPISGEHFAAWVPFMSILPAILLFVLLFMETHICE